MLCFNDLLKSAGIEPNQVDVMLHSPQEARLARMLPAYIRSRPEVLLAYQSRHSSGPARRTLGQGRPYVASFVKIGDGRLVFAGQWRNMGWQQRRFADVLREPGAAFLNQTFGMDDADRDTPPDALVDWLDLRASDALDDLRARLVIGATLTRAYVRLGENLPAPVLAILEAGADAGAPPDWDEFIVSGTELRALPPSWAARLREWRGVYLIVDKSDGARYVGAAYGKDILLGRWREHVAHTHGVTRELSRRNPVNFRFSILQLVVKTATPQEVIHLEHNWMDRLHTREFGLNA